MKAKIIKNGVLQIERAGSFKSFKEQPYPFTPGNGPVFCGDWCPLLDENTLHGELRVLLKCSATTQYFENVTDERPKS